MPEAVQDWADDPTILPHHLLWRRVPGWHFVYDENRNRIRPSSAAFANDADGSPMSVQLAQVLVQLHLGEDEVLQGHRGFAISRLTAEVVRGQGQVIARDPQPLEPAHALVVGSKPERVCKNLMKFSEWHTEPAALVLTGGVLLFEDRDGWPCLRGSNGRRQRLSPGPPPDPGWPAILAQWLLVAENRGLPFHEAVVKAARMWGGDAE